jgi:flagellar motor switch protein FliM
MTTQKTNTIGLKVGDVISFTNKVNSHVKITVARVEEKSWYTTSGGRNSYGTLESYMKYPDFKITKQ